MTKFLLSIAILAIAGSATAERPNILFAIADDASYPHMSAYGTPWIKTPGFDRVAKSGLLFHNAYTPNAKCAPSRSCVLTGRNSWQLEEAANHVCVFPPKFKSYVEALDDNGYFVGYVAKGWGPGIALNEEGKPRQMTGKAFNAKKAKPPAKSISNSDYAGNFEDFLTAAPEGEPWAFWYGSTEPHRRYEYGAGVAKGGKKLTDIDKVPGFWPDNDEVRNDMLDYAFEIEHFDSHLARMLDSLEKSGQLENTLVVVTSDNGMPFPRVKGQEYELSNHLPMAVMWPKGVASPGREVQDYVSFIDLAPTFLDVAGVDWAKSGMQTSPGRSLTDIFAGETPNPPRDHVLIGKERHDIGRPNDWGYPIRGIVKGGMLYLENYETDRWPAGNPETGYLNTDGGATKTSVLNLRRSGENDSFWKLCFGKRESEELFKLDKDRDCLNNLAKNPEYESVKDDLRQHLLTALKEQGDPRVDGKGHIFDEYQYWAESTRGFHERYTGGEKLKAGWVNESDFEEGPLD